MRPVDRDASARSALVAKHILSAIAHNRPDLLTPQLFRHLLATNKGTDPGLGAELEWTGSKWRFGGYTFRSDSALYANAAMLAALPLGPAIPALAETFVVTKTVGYAAVVAMPSIAVNARTGTGTADKNDDWKAQSEKLYEEASQLGDIGVKALLGIEERDVLSSAWGWDFSDLREGDSVFELAVKAKSLTTRGATEQWELRTMLEKLLELKDELEVNVEPVDKALQIGRAMHKAWPPMTRSKLYQPWDRNKEGTLAPMFSSAFNIIIDGQPIFEHLRKHKESEELRFYETLCVRTGLNEGNVNQMRDFLMMECGIPHAEVDSLKYARSAVKAGYKAPLERMSHYECQQFLEALGSVKPVKEGHKTALEGRLMKDDPGTKCALAMRSVSWSCGESLRICAKSFTQPVRMSVHRKFFGSRQ